MDCTKWPWSWEEEAEWKAELENRDYSFLEDLIDSAVEGGIADLRDVLGSPWEDNAEEDDTLEKYSVTA
ncbi:MAG TPA: hypothetical protein VEI01_12880 [Terriglobales bacterium]|nr:hypothetical protein [Terriglobales bacterium]